jgi:acyl carrier protein
MSPPVSSAAASVKATDPAVAASNPSIDGAWGDRDDQLGAGTGRVDLARVAGITNIGDEVTNPRRAVLSRRGRLRSDVGRITLATAPGRDSLSAVGKREPRPRMTVSANLGPKLEDITAALVNYVLTQHPSKFNADTLPRGESLLELEVLDSAGVIEFIVFAESTWGIEISDEDITTERMGSLNRMAALVQEYIAAKKR